MGRILLLLVVLTGYVYSQNESPEPAITPEEVIGHISYLASDELKGRLAGNEGAYKAAEYIAEDFKKQGLFPFFGDSYFQEFKFVQGVEITGSNSLIFTLSDTTISATIKKEYTPAPFSGTGSVEAPLVFAGYGISAPDKDYDDYANLDVNGKIVLVMRFTPEYDNPHSELGRFASFRHKAVTAKEKGAAGIIFVNGFYPETDDKLMDFEYDGAPGFEDFPAAQVSREIVNTIFKNAGKNFAEIQKNISEKKTPDSFLFENVTAALAASVVETEATGRNVAAILKTENNSPAEYIVIGAHYDHLGMGGSGSLYRGEEPMVHNGADDNASGTAGLLELAEKFAAEYKGNRDIIFAAFSGEEKGLLGSQYMVENFPVPLEEVTAMINMDMIGRMKDSSLTVFGTGTAAEWENLLKEKGENYYFNLSLKKEGFSPSDNSSFYAKEIPVLFFFTGTHKDYHRPSDDTEFINEEAESDILNYIYDVSSDIAGMEGRPAYIHVPREKTGGGGWSVYVGTIPDYSYTGEGFRITGVSEESPAKKGGLQGGDIMLAFGDKELNNIYDYVYALQEHVPGDVVKVKVKRDGEIKTFEVTLGVR